MTVARTLAAFLTQVSYADLPPQTIEHAAMLIASTVASAACGSGIDSAAMIRDLARERGGTPQASIWFDSGSQMKLPVADAAWVNAVMSDAAASDDSDLRNIVHAGTPLVATSLATAERTGASGQDVLAAIVLGYEAAGRIGEAVTPGFRAQGFHGCLIAIFAGAAATARLLGLDAAHMAQAIALSATSIGGLMAAANTSVAREYHAELAAMLGGQAALAAQRGFMAEEGILETEQGFFAVYGNADGANVTRDLGASWDIITDMAVKLVPGGHPHHALAEAAANAARAGRIVPDEVETITLSRPGVKTLAGPLHPANLIDMAHSPAYFLAAGVADHDFSWVHASESKITDPVIHQLIDKVRVGEPPTEQAEQYKQGATVTIRTTDGRTFSNTVLAPKGAGILGIDWADIDAKYRTLMPLAHMRDEQIEASLQIIHDFRHVTHVSALVDLLRV
ncbi:MmgE/PrpD family protein [Candidatus Entotheonella palauensis]|uniref:MmgE/PrpD family protein n=1 Tax=Candidatus Entotheonella palauensis TaxID=93172 RepID=UPI000B7FF6E4|nr:MmgE/PrpD family protein [Candidatus Entotheonella palauensis]